MARPTYSPTHHPMFDSDPTKRFSIRVDDYVRYRPHYPAEVLDVLRDDTGLTPAAVIADIGSGTGILSELFLRNGSEVFGVEPNAEMRRAGEELLREYPRFHSIAARAEATTLADASADYTVAGQAFHWFDPDQARREFARILRPGGWAVLVWNTRRIDATPLHQEYEALMNRYGIDYHLISHRNVDEQAIRQFFVHGHSERRLSMEQRFDLAGLKGRLLSCSYAPTVGHPNYEPMMNELQRIFHRHQTDNSVCFQYDTELFFGRLA